MKGRMKNRFLRDTETFTRNSSIQVKLESGKSFAGNFSGKNPLFFLDDLLHNLWRFLVKSKTGSDASSIWKGHTETEFACRKYT